MHGVGCFAGDDMDYDDDDFDGPTAAEAATSELPGSGL